VPRVPTEVDPDGADRPCQPTGDEVTYEEALHLAIATLTAVAMTATSELLAEQLLHAAATLEGTK
jgi:hypothetical protein